MTIQEKIEYLRHCSPEEWESLCKGCGLCCLCKHSRREGVYYTRVACNNLDLNTRRCTVYDRRLRNFFCRRVDLRTVLQSGLLPDTCGYREFIYGKSDKTINVDFNNVIHERDMSRATPTVPGVSFDDAPMAASMRHRTPGVWDFIIPESLDWHTKQR